MTQHAFPILTPARACRLHNGVRLADAVPQAKTAARRRSVGRSPCRRQGAEAL